ncbi:hypothetical protein [Clostridium luticellarii]|jgi:hypothetical protein|uniref:Uncharacterized protein n=1 Tax=Clostridium luticellarii TaxID=1691940 RepID=A0A2T0BQJ2_9CLOT|nr:hypothetical protein [Clostridium luticellarii]MCI1944769.1 hypothetical protein [Clostridium luticellarii]MCI1968264.1 hypothetical protein [Clostridium luticellarii]MCI1995699.1 hypothetical protein [Clostridium luticellarii]MCI2040221.1 hypothetical protein [Clostridium luticellarii]PRR86139.1 hypothetical protein CLLU_07880 [Clostridium luticellarii]
MKKLLYRIIKQGQVRGILIPLNIVFVDIKDIENSGLEIDEAIEKIAQQIKGPAGINVFDMDACTTSSDGIVLDSAIIKMAASDNGKIHREFGMIPMEEMEVTDQLIGEEPHLAQWKKYYSGRKLFRGPNPAKKMIPVHNAVMTGRAVNNNSATEMMNVVTMEEILLPIFGQLQIMKDQDVLIGYTGEFISVGIGMTVAEKYGRVFPTRQFKAGDTAHGSGEYAKTLKKHIPCIVAPKEVIAKYTIDALKAGMVPGKHIGCSPVVLSVARYLGSPIAFDNITEKARAELASVGITFDYLKTPVKKLSEEEIIAKADEIVPGVEKPVRISSTEFVAKENIEV